MTVAIQPIGPQEGGRLLASCDRPLALAVSGGIDSMALMHLVAGWRRAGGGNAHPAPLVLTVDHGLRPAAAEEARFVAAEAGRLGFAHETLAWTGAKPSSGIQDAARDARYRLMLEHLAALAMRRDLLLAHHQEDQAETLLMRLARGSGIDGLSAMRPSERRVVVVLGDPVREVAIRVRRPLLAIPKARLVATVEAMGGSWRDDPTNADVRFERVRVRRALPHLTRLGLTADGLGRSVRRLAAERAAALGRAAALAGRHVRDHAGAFGELMLPPPPDRQPADLVRMLARLLGVYGGAAPPAQLSQIETLAERVLSASPQATGRLTLGGCIIDIAGAGLEERRLTCFREMTRADLPPVTLAPGEGVFWDRRFYVSLARTASAPVSVVPCPPAAAAGLAGPRDHVASLPALGTAASATLLFGRSDLPASCVWPMQHAAALRWEVGCDGDCATI